MADRDRDLFVGDEVFEVNFGGFVFDDGLALVAVLLFDLFEFLDDHAAQFLFGREDGLVLGNALAEFFQIVGDFIDAKPVQAMQLQFEDCVSLPRGEGLLAIEFGGTAGGVDVDLLAAEVGDQVLAGVGAVGAGADDDDHVIEMIEGGQVAFEDVLAVLRLGEQVGGAAADDFDAVVDEVLDGLHQPHLAGLTVSDRQENHAEALLHVGVLEELVQDDLGLGAALQFDHDAHAFAIAFVANVGDVVDDLVVDEIGDALDQAGFVHLVGDFGDDDGLLILGEVLDGSTGAHHETAASGFVRVDNSGTAMDDASGRKVRTLNKLEDLGQSGVRIINQRDGGIDDLGEIVRRNFRGHADSDAVGTIDQQIRDARGKNFGFDFAVVVVGAEVNGFLVEVLEQRGGDLGELGFGVTVGRGRIAVNGAKVCLSEY